MADGLRVATGELNSFGDELISKATQLDADLDAIKENMDLVKDDWKDDNGNALASKYDAFVKDAKKINADLTTLGQHAKAMSGKYVAIVEKYAGMMS